MFYKEKYMLRIAKMNLSIFLWDSLLDNYFSLDNKVCQSLPGKPYKLSQRCRFCNSLDNYSIHYSNYTYRLHN